MVDTNNETENIIFLEQLQAIRTLTIDCKYLHSCDHIDVEESTLCCLQPLESLELSSRNCDHSAIHTIYTYVLYICAFVWRTLHTRGYYVTHRSNSSDIKKGTKQDAQIQTLLIVAHRRVATLQSHLPLLYI